MTKLLLKCTLLNIKMEHNDLKLNFKVNREWLKFINKITFSRESIAFLSFLKYILAKSVK